MSIKKLLMVGAVLVGLSGLANAASVSQAVAISATVPEVFSLLVSGGGAFAPLGNTQQTKTVALTINTNKGTSWAVQFSALPLTHSDGVTQVPASYFQYNVTGQGAVGTFSPASGAYANVPAAPTNVYQAALSEYSVSFFSLSIGVKLLPLPASQKTGTYSTNLNVILVDAI